MVELYSPRIQAGDGLWSIGTRDSTRHPINVMMNVAFQRGIGPFTQNGSTTLASRLMQVASMAGGTTIAQGGD